MGKFERGVFGEAFTKAVEEKRQKELESNADYQRRKGMTREEKAREAKDRMTQNVLEHRRRTGQSDDSRSVERDVERITSRYVNEVEK